MLTAIAVIAGIPVVFVTLTYPRCHREMSAARARLAAGATTLKTDRGLIEYAIEGEGDPVLCLHGAGGGYDQGLWAARMALGQGRRFVSVSRYGYLRTPIPRDATIRTQAALYKDLLDHLGIRKVIVLAISAGGPSATQFANDYPERTSALILLSAVSQASLPGDKPGFYVNIIHLIQRSDYAYWLVARFMQPTILNLMGIPSEVYGKLTPAQKQLAQEMLDAMHPMSLRYQGTVNDGRMIQREAVSTGNVQAPVLILHAKDDALVSYHHAARARESIQHARLISFDDGGHGLLPHMNEVRQEVSELLKPR